MSFTLDFSTFWWELTNWETDDRFQKLSAAIVKALNQFINQTKDNELAENLKTTSLHFDQFIQEQESIDPAEFFSHFESFEKVCENWDIDIRFVDQMDEER